MRPSGPVTATAAKPRSIGHSTAATHDAYSRNYTGTNLLDEVLAARSEAPQEVLGTGGLKQAGKDDAGRSLDWQQ